MSWIAQLERALARKDKGPDSSPGPQYNFSLSILTLMLQKIYCALFSDQPSLKINENSDFVRKKMLKHDLLDCKNWILL